MDSLPYATVQYAGDDFFVGTAPSGSAITLDTNGQRKAAPGPLELLLVSLGGCTATDVISVLKKKREKVTDYRVEIRGERRDEHPRSYKRIEVKHIVTGHGVSAASVEKAVHLSTDKYCSVAATLRPTAEIVSTWEIHEAEA